MALVLLNSLPMFFSIQLTLLERGLVSLSIGYFKVNVGQFVYVSYFLAFSINIRICFSRWWWWNYCKKVSSKFDNYRILDKSSKVMGNLRQMDFFCLDWKSNFCLFWHEIFLYFQNFFSHELESVYNLMVHTKLNFHQTNPLSWRALSLGGRNPYFQVSKTNFSPEALVLTPGTNFT